MPEEIKGRLDVTMEARDFNNLIESLSKIKSAILVIVQNTPIALRNGYMTEAILEINHALAQLDGVSATGAALETPLLIGEDMTKRAYYNALDALWMMERHEMTFSRFKGNGGEWAALDWWDTLRHRCLERDAKVYPDPAGLALLEPRVGDVIFMYGNVYLVAEDGTEIDGTTQLTEARANKDAVIFRDSTPFIMPQWE